MPGGLETAETLVKKWLSSLIHTLENIALFFEVEALSERMPIRTNTPSIVEVLNDIKSKNSSWAVSDAISQSHKHGVAIFFYLSKLN